MMFRLHPSKKNAKTLALSLMFMGAWAFAEIAEEPFIPEVARHVFPVQSRYVVLTDQLMGNRQSPPVAHVPLCEYWIVEPKSGAELPAGGRWNSCHPNGMKPECADIKKRDALREIGEGDHIIGKGVLKGKCLSIHARLAGDGFWVITNVNFHFTGEYGDDSITFLDSNGKLLHSGRGYDFIHEDEYTKNVPCCGPRSGLNDVFNEMWEDPEDHSIRVVAGADKLRAIRWGTWEVFEPGESGIRAAFQNPDPKIRFYAVWLAASGDPEPFQTELKIAAGDNNNLSLAKTAATIGLARLGDETATKQLWADTDFNKALPSLENTSDFNLLAIRKLAIVFLPHRKDGADFTRLEAYLENDEYFTAALQGLSVRGEKGIFTLARRLGKTNHYTEAEEITRTLLEHESDGGVIALKNILATGQVSTIEEILPSLTELINPICDEENCAPNKHVALVEKLAPDVQAAWRRIGATLNWKAAIFFIAARHLPVVPFLRKQMVAEKDCKTKGRIDDALFFQRTGKRTSDSFDKCQ